MLISGGASLPKETQELFLGLGLPLSEGYGLTEAAPVLTASRPSPKTRSGHVGKPIPGVEIKHRQRRRDRRRRGARARPERDGGLYRR